MTTFTSDQQEAHRASFIQDCRQKAWNAACHADFISKELDGMLGQYTKMQAEDREMEARMKELELAADSHMRDNREKRKAFQEKRNVSMAHMKALGTGIQQGQQALSNLYASIESNLALARHAEGWEWKEASTGDPK